MIVDVEDSVKTCRSCTAAKGRLDVIRVNVDQSDAANLTWKESRRSTATASQPLQPLQYARQFVFVFVE